MVQYTEWRSISDGSIISSIPDVLVDNFEDSQDVDGAEEPFGIYGPDEDLSDYYKGDLANYARTTDDPAIGDYALEWQSNQNLRYDTVVISEPGDGLPNYPEQEDTIRCLLRDFSGPESRLGPAVVFNADYDAGEDEVDGYAVGIDNDQNEIKIWKLDGFNAIAESDRQKLAGESTTIDTDTWYWIEADLVDESGNIEGRVYGYDESENERDGLKATVTTTDTDISPSNRGIGWFKRDDSPGTAYDELFIVD